MEQPSGFREWATTLLAAAIFSAVFFSIVVGLKHRGWNAIDVFFSGVGGPVVLCAVAGVGSYFVSRRAPTAVAKWGLAIGVFILTMLVQAIIVLVTFCALGECL